MKYKLRSLAGSLLAIVLFFGLPVFLNAAQSPLSTGGKIALGLFGLIGIGATTILYTYPSGGQGGLIVAANQNTATAPTAAQASLFSLLTAKFQMTDTETSCTFTHNWGLSGTETNQYFPIPSAIMGFANLGTAGGNSWGVSTYGANTIVLTKGSTTGSGGTFTVQFFRPTTVVR